MHLGILSGGMKNWGDWFLASKSFGQLESEFQETVFNVAPVYRSRAANEVLHVPNVFLFYNSPTYSRDQGPG